MTTSFHALWVADFTYVATWRGFVYRGRHLKAYADGREARAGIGEWIRFYNNCRPHQALGNRTPMAVWRDGVTGGLGDSAVDMTLRLDNADALPTYPQPQQQVKVA